MDMSHLDYLTEVAEADVNQLLEKEKTYQGSWKKRGGLGTAMMLLRKIDRLEVILKAADYDIFKVCLVDLTGKDGSALAEIRDLRRYLLLVEAEVIAQTPTPPAMPPEENRPGTPEDGGHHARQDSAFGLGFPRKSP